MLLKARVPAIHKVPQQAHTWQAAVMVTEGLAVDVYSQRLLKGKGFLLGRLVPGPPETQIQHPAQ